MTYPNLLLVLSLLALQNFAESGYGAFSATSAVLILAVIGLATFLYGCSRLAAWVLSPRNADARPGIATVLGHLLVIAVAAQYFFAPQLASGLRSFAKLASLPLRTGLWLLGIGALYLLLRRITPRTLGTFFACSLLGALAVAAVEAAIDPGPPRFDQDAAVGNVDWRPNLYYIVLDGQTGFPAFPAFIDGALQERDRQRTAYEALGFEIYEKAHSNHMWTDRSLYSIFDNRLHDSPPGTDDARIMPPNKFFETVLSSGYRPLIYQTDHFDICSGAAAYRPDCRVYPINNLSSRPATSQQHILLLMGFVNRFLPFPILKEKRRIIGISNALSVIDQMIVDIPRYSTSTFVFAHLLVPHEPFVLDGDCSVRNSAVFDLSFSSYYYTIDELEAELRWRGYLPQSACVSRRLEELVAALKAAGIYDESTIIVHGDHGSRISLTGQYGPAGDRDRVPERLFLDFYSALFMIKRGGFALEPASGEGRSSWASISTILSNLMGWEAPANSSAVYNDSLAEKHQLEFDLHRATP